MLVASSRFTGVRRCQGVAVKEHAASAACYYFAVRGTAGKVFVTMLLTLCVGVYVLEMSGRWDRSIQDANDEAGIVTIVLCVGVALSAAGFLIAHIRASRTTARVTFATSTAPCRRGERRILLPASTSSPPLRLRI